MHKHTNRLANETSPYLLQHAHNPVDWYAWGEEAFAKARAENKPVFLSIGYSACHWCHVMERESFENEATAALLNEHFVSIKVDREERPDVDSIYMQAVQMMTGHGGWPMSMFLTPEGVPFYGGTYFPPDDRHGLPSFPRVLEHVARAYRERPDEVLQVSGEMRSALATENRAGAANEPLSEEMLHAVARRFVASFDAINGGFGGAPKFPPSMSLDFLMQVARRQRDTQLQEIVEMTLERMASGGIYDQVGGGFHRYSVDARWLVPHFEKMLYDNALLVRAYVHAWQWTKSPFYERVVRETLGFVQREMTSPDGGFYSTLDADSEGEEGKFYVWTRKEILDVLGEDEGRKFCALYDVSERGNWEGHNILNLPRALETVAADLALTTDELVDIAQRGKCKLYGKREERVRPGRDEKILAGWNGWMLAAFSEAAMAFDSDDYREVVRRNADFLIGTMIIDGRLHRSHKDGRTRIPALLEDYAGVAWGLLHAFEATQERRFLDTAAKLGNEIIDRFADAPGTGFFDTPHDHETLIARPKDLFDNATPAGNSVAAELFQKLALYFAEERYRTAAESAAGAALSLALQHPSAFGFLLGSLGYQLGRAIEIAITGSESRSYAKVAGEQFLPHRIIVSSAQPDIPLMRNRPSGKDAAYVCRGYECLRPATSVEEFQAQLESVTRAGAP